MSRSFESAFTIALLCGLMADNTPEGSTGGLVWGGMMVVWAIVAIVRWQKGEE